MVPRGVAAGAGLALAGTWADCVTAATTLWGADAEQRRFLADSAVAVAASSAGALQWLVSPMPGPPSWAGGRQGGEARIPAVGQGAGSYRGLDNPQGGGPAA